MATTDFDFVTTRAEIIKRAYWRIGAIPFGSTPTTLMDSEGANLLNQMVKNWQTRHVFLWTIKPVAITLTGSTATYDVGTDQNLIGLDKAYLQTASDSRLAGELEIIGKSEYEAIQDKITLDTPQAICLDNYLAVATRQKVTVWPTPTTAAAAAYKVYVTGVLKLKDWDTTGAGADFDAKWEAILVAGLAAELAPNFGLDLNERQTLTLEFERLFNFGSVNDSEMKSDSGIKSCYGE